MFEFQSVLLMRIRQDCYNVFCKLFAYKIILPKNSLTEYLLKSYYINGLEVLKKKEKIKLPQSVILLLWKAKILTIKN